MGDTAGRLVHGGLEVRALTLMVACCVVFGCATAKRPSTNELMAAAALQKASETQFSPEEEYYIGRAVAARLIAAYRPYENENATQYVNLIGRALVANSERPETFSGYHFQILDSDALNSFSAPGGFILITRGLLRLSNSEDMVAGVLAYSISHVVMNSGLESIKKSRQVDAYLKLALASLQESEDREWKQMDPSMKELATALWKLTAQYSLNNQQVLDADKMAVSLASRTGYDPRGLRDVLVLLSAREPSQSSKESEFPALKDRIAGIEKELAKLKIQEAKQEDNESRRARFVQALGGI